MSENNGYLSSDAQNALIECGARAMLEIIRSKLMKLSSLRLLLMDALISYR